MKKIAIIGAVTILCVACTPHRYVYKVTFKNGTYDYYDLPHKVKKGATSFDYEGETIIGVKQMELVK